METCRTSTFTWTHFLRIALCLGLTGMISINDRAAASTADDIGVDAQASRIDPSQRGPFATATAQYKFAATQDNDVLPQAETEIWARVFWPRELSQPMPSKTPHPILFFLHGNHPTCGSGQNPRVDSSCEYTTIGSCPAGTVVVPNHEGYNYLAEHLASHGFIVVSINANRGITCGGGTSNDSGLNLARGRLILRHIQKWMSWSTTGGAPKSLKVAANSFIGAVDFSHVGLLGHSRGGEGARAAYNLYRDPGSPWQKKIPGLHITGIYEIGAVDGQTSRVLDADDTSWNQLLPMCDGDVSDFAGRMPFERMLMKRHESRPTPKSLYMVWGANHNFFNTEWQVSDSQGCSGHPPIFGSGYKSVAQQKVAIVSATSFFMSHVGTEAPLAAHFDPSVQLPSSVTSITRITRDQIPTYDEAFDTHLEDFTEPTGTSSHHIANLANGIKIVHEGYTPRHAGISWKTADTENFAQFNFAAPGSGMTVDNFANLDFRVARQANPTDRALSTSFSVALIGPQDQILGSVPTLGFAEIVGPATYTDLYQTVRIPLSALRLAHGTLVRGVRFVFDQSSSGAIYLADIRLSSPAPAALNLSLSEDVMLKMADEFANSQLISLRTDQPREIFSAQLVQLQAAPQSPFLQNEDAIEFSVHSQTPFPVQDQLPLLIIGDQAFSVSRYADSTKMDTLIFSIPRSRFLNLAESGTMKVQYGNSSFELSSAAKVWHLPVYQKSSFHILSRDGL